MTPAYAYLRVSGKGQIEGDGFDRQLAAISQYCTEQNLELKHVYREEGISGKSDHDARPAMIEMLKSLQTGDVRTIIIEKMDRLARDLIIQEGIIARLQKMGATIVSTCEPDLCSNDPSRKFIRRVLGAVAELDRDLTVARARAARERIRASGRRCEGPKPYGWEKDGNGSARMNQAEQDTIALVIRLYAQTKSTLTTANKLNSLGYKTRRGKGWQAMQVSRILARSKNSQEAHK